MVSVVLPVRDARDDLERTLVRLRETLHGLAAELIIVNDGPRDGTSEFLREIGPLPFDLTVLASADSGGVALARNAAASVARGKYFWFIDADDEWPHNALQVLMGAAQKYSADIVIGRARRRVAASNRSFDTPAPSDERVLTAGEYFGLLLTRSVEGHLWNKLFHKKLVHENPFAQMRSKSDLRFCIEVAPHAARVATISDYVYEYVSNDGSISNSRVATPLDMFRCLESATAVGQRLEFRSVFEPTRTTFEVGVVIRAALTEVWRYGDAAQASRLATSYSRGLLSLRTSFHLLLHRNYRLAAFALALVVAPSLVRRAYVSRRRDEWGPREIVTTETATNEN